jgi:hypothetical protein
MIELVVVHLAAQIDHQPLLDEPVDRDGVGVIQPRPAAGQHEDETREHPEHLPVLPLIRQREVQLVRVERRALDLVPDVIDADAGQAQAADAHRQEDELDGQDLQAVQPVAPGEREQPPDESPVR